MFSLLRLLVLLAVGFYLGYVFKDNQITDQCAAANGNLDGALCRVSGG